MLVAWMPKSPFSALSLQAQFAAAVQCVAYIPYARHYNQRFVYFLPPLYIEEWFILQTTYGLKMEILHFLSLKSAVYTQERLLIKSGL